jgi:hypothetical protein
MLPLLRNAVARPGSALRGVPRILDDLPVLTRRPDIDRIISFRGGGGLNRASGRFGDAIIGQQSLQFNIPLITEDKELARAVLAAGGKVR